MFLEGLDSTHYGWEEVELTAFLLFSWCLANSLLFVLEERRWNTQVLNFFNG